MAPEEGARMNRADVLREIRKMRFLEVYERCQMRRLSYSEAAETLGVSERTFRRMRGRFEAEGEDGLVDRRVGKPSPHRISVTEADRIAGLYRDRYLGWTVKHFHERCQERHELTASYGWTKSVLHAAGLVRPAAQRSAHRKKRPRRPLPGMLLHQDGSRYLWLPALERQIDLIVTMDDATSAIYSMFLVEEEGTASSFCGLIEVIERHGLFCSLYTDRGSHYFHTPKAGAKVAKEQPTQVGRALAQLGIRHIPAYSPEARGRSERMFGTLQNRLVKELADADIRTIEAANRFIAETYLPEHNRRFAIGASEPGSAFVPWTGGSLREILCHQEDRVVGNDNTVVFGRIRLQIEPSPLRHHFAKATVQVRRYLNGTIVLFYGPRCIGRFAPDGAPIDTVTKAA
jgi:transposase